jgi:D-aminoacyl-tRNA deacylase
MRAIVQRVSSASVRVDGKTVAAIARGLLVLVGVSSQDGVQDAKYIADKIAGLRIFPDDADRMNRAVGEVGGALLVVPQFTLYGDCRKGRRPSFDQAAPPPVADALYGDVVRQLREQQLPVETGVFQRIMEVELVNDGPVTLILDSSRLL